MKLAKEKYSNYSNEYFMKISFEVHFYLAESYEYLEQF
jgi:hypothetical protein